uniref:Acyl-[acyl-carrier-protein] hydrolase n=1 Tax=Myristica fragrans TaxID=51089 RepID=O24419_MYRFG|nr:acyl-ACP thioesterase [Myristica fragrans]
MVATSAASAFFPVASPSPVKPSMMLGGGGGSDNLDARGIKSRPASSGGLQVKANAHTVPKINGNKAGLLTPMESTKDEDIVAAPTVAPKRTFINQLPDWSMLLAAITTIFLAAEKQWTNLDWKPRRPDMLVDFDPFSLGRFVQDGLIFRQNFSIRSYEIGADRTASIETLMNHLQETALNHVRCIGLLDDGFGSTPEMTRRDLIWVVTRMQVLVDRYPSWGDVIEVDSWVTPSGKNGMKREWFLRDCKTGEILTRATSVWVMMNKRTRRLSKIPEEVRVEIEPYFVEHGVLDEDSRKLPKLNDNTANYIRRGLAPRWSDLDVNQHVNNVKYIGWILESVPSSLLESHELYGMTLEYRKECGKDGLLQSLTAVASDYGGGSLEAGVECDHLLRLEDGSEIMRGKTEWRPKRAANTTYFGSVDDIPPANNA